MTSSDQGCWRLGWAGKRRLISCKVTHISQSDSLLPWLSEHSSSMFHFWRDSKIKFCLKCQLCVKWVRGLLNTSLKAIVHLHMKYCHLLTPRMILFCGTEMLHSSCYFLCKWKRIELVKLWNVSYKSSTFNNLYTIFQAFWMRMIALCEKVAILWKSYFSPYSSELQSISELQWRKIASRAFFKNSILCQVY